MSKLVPMDVMCELASAIVERDWAKTHWESEPHSTENEHGDVQYVEEAQAEFNEVLDLIDEIVNPKED